MSLNRVSNNNAGGARSQLGINANNSALENTEQLRKTLGNSNIAASRQLKDSIGFSDHRESARLYRERSANAVQQLGVFPGFEAKKGTTLEDFKKITKEAAGNRPNNFARQYTLGSIYSTLADFNKEQSKYWKDQDEFISINSDVLLTKELESHYKTLISMEDEYKSMVESGKQIDSFKVKGDINRFKMRIDTLKAHMVKNLT
jgi:hypothetical protein